MKLFFVVEALLASPFTCLLAWKRPRWFLFLLRAVAIVDFLAVLVIWVLRRSMPDYLHMNYVQHNAVVMGLLFCAWYYLTGILALWIRLDGKLAGLRWIVLIILVNVLWWTQPRYPTETILRAHFFKHRAVFEQLVAMVQADRPLLLATDYSSARIDELAHSSPQRLVAYKRMADRLGLNNDHNSYAVYLNGDMIDFTYSSRDGFGEGANGYTYILSSREPAPLIPWEAPDPVLSAFDQWYRPLVPHWYVNDGRTQVIMP